MKIKDKWAAFWLVLNLACLIAALICYAIYGVFTPAGILNLVAAGSLWEHAFQ